jgi:outer membrane usher protein
VREARKSVPPGVDLPIEFDWLNATAQASAIDTAAISFKPWFDKASSFSANYSHVKAPRFERETAGATYSRRLTHNIDFMISGYRDIKPEREWSAFLTLNISFDRANRGRVALNERNGRTSYTTEFSHTSSGTQQGNLNWTVGRSHAEGAGDSYYGYGGYLTPFAGLSGQFVHNDGALTVSGQVRGSLVLTEGSLFAANRIGNGFAVVKGAGPGSEIRQDGVAIAKTNKAGKALLPYLQPYTWHRITADPTNLPDDWELPETEVRAITSYRQGTTIDFKGGPVHGAVIILHGANGKPIPLGSLVRLEGGEETRGGTGEDDGFFVGQDGQVYVTGLAASNTLIVDIADDGTCRASFSYDAQGQAQPTIGPVTCQ